MTHNHLSEMDVVHARARWAHGKDTLQIAEEMSLPEATIYNALAYERNRRRTA